MSGSIALTVADQSFRPVVHYGYGKHLIAVPMANIVPILQWTVVDYFGFAFAISFARWSILALIARVFTLQDRVLRYGVWILAVYTFLWCLGNNLAIGLSCQPFNTFWSATAPCSLKREQTIWTSTFNIIGDAGVILLPQHKIWSLQMSFGRKLAVSCLMALGVL